MDQSRNLNGLVYKDFTWGESWGGLDGGGYGINIEIAYTQRELDNEDRWAIRSHVEAIENIIRGRTYREDPKVIAACAEQKTKLLAAFEGHLIYAKAVPNEYFSPDEIYGQMHPWFLVTTTRGIIKLGWRKRVINLEWDQSDIPKDAVSLFTEDVTKGPGYIHCYGYESLKQHVQALLSYGIDAKEV